jgi:NADP-dependent 3-hydroxy acid dehydrogenase YdfG
MMNYLKDKTVIITGASSGIGAASARELAAHGARIVIAARDAEGVEAMVDELRASGAQALGYVCDVTSRAEMVALAQFAQDSFGSVDILINNAGLMLFSNWTDVAIDDWDKMVDVNIKGYLNAIAAVLPWMMRQGSGQILNMDSVAGHQVGPAAGAYSATKFFVQAMTESMRKELGVHHGIRVNTVQSWSDQHWLGR